MPLPRLASLAVAPWQWAPVLRLVEQSGEDDAEDVDDRPLQTFRTLSGTAFVSRVRHYVVVDPWPLAALFKFILIFLNQISWQSTDLELNFDTHAGRNMSSSQRELPEYQIAPHPALHACYQRARATAGL